MEKVSEKVTMRYADLMSLVAGSGMDEDDHIQAGIENQILQKAMKEVPPVIWMKY